MRITPMPTKDQIVEAARRWIGVPWKHQGRSRLGIDCAGLVVKIAHEFNLTDFDATNYQRNTRGLEFVNYFREHMNEVPLTAIQEGDVILFRDSKFPCHSAIVSKQHGEFHIIHAFARRKQVLEEPLNAEWKSKWISAFRYKGVES